MKTPRFHSFLVPLCALIALGTSGCLDKKKAVTTKSTSAAASSSGFAGATSAANLATDGLAIQVSWAAAAAPYTTYTVYRVGSDGTYFVLKSKIPLNQTSYTQTGLSSGSVYSFAVRAFKSDNVTNDGNEIVVSTIAYAGINRPGGAAGVSLNQAFINFAAAGAQAQGVRIDCRNTLGSAVRTQDVFNTSITTYLLTGLYSGTTYNCKVNVIYQDYWGMIVNDSNALTYSFQTISQSYTQTTPAYQGVILVQAFGDAPTAPTATTAPVSILSPATVPTTRQVNITWKNFNVALPLQAQYRVVRVKQGGVLDMNTTAVCTAATITACQVCVSTTATNTVSRTCSDPVASIGKSPNRYEYAVSLIVDPMATPPLAEEMPAASSDAPFRILVPIPPDNMVLVHRDSVNYEICSYMGLSTDPLNNQRCAYTGFGAIPYSTNAFMVATPLTLKGNPNTPYDGVVNNGAFYDFGYNLFVDRWEAACNWTPSAATETGGTGMCGAGATSGDCYGGTGAPLGSIGIDGNIYYDTQTSRCYQKFSGTWLAWGYTGATQGQLDAMMTSIPSTVVQKPPFTDANTMAGSMEPLCNAKMDPNYGPKRLLSRREAIGAAGWQWMPGEPNQLSIATITALQLGASHPSMQGCNSWSGNGVASSPGGLTGVLNPNQKLVFGGSSNAGFMTGSHMTANCMSRFGAQDMIGNMAEGTSDRFTCSTVTHTCTGTSQDMIKFQQYNFDGVISNTGPGSTGHGQIGPNYTNTWTLSAQLYGATFLSVPTGMLFVSSNFGNAMSVTSLRSSDQSAQMKIQTDNGGVSRYLYTGGDYAQAVSNSRFSIWLYHAGNEWFGFRCALPAE